VEIVIDGGPMWPEPSTILQADGNEFVVSRVGKGPIPET
jgi:tRNA A37 threonylcarbamoyladenosine synthetase subunit TsaC/SUA5/YrdC